MGRYKFGFVFAVVVGVACVGTGAQVCDEVPLFGPQTGGRSGTWQPCTPDREAVACGCSEVLTWDAPPVPPVDWYVVQRRVVGGPQWYTVGNVNRVAYCTDPELCEDTPNASRVPRRWFPALDDPSMPRAFELYEYRVQACAFDRTCGGWSNVVRYRAAPYACFDGGVEVPCYDGDEVLQ